MSIRIIASYVCRQTNFQRTTVALIAGLLLAAALAGCAASIDTELPPRDEGATAIKKLPLTVGIFYDPSFRNYISNQCVLMGSPPPCDYYDTALAVNVGETSVALFDRTMQALFARVERLDDRHPAPRNSHPLAAIFEPEIVQYRYSYGGPSYGWSARIDYRLVLRLPEGEELARWAISGSGKSRGGPGWFLTRIENATLVALRAAEANALAQFHDQQGVRRWLASHGIPTASSGRTDK